MVKTPIKKAVSSVKAKLPDPGRFFYKVAVRDAVARGDIAQAKQLLAAAQEIKAAGGLDPLIADLQNAIARGK